MVRDPTKVIRVRGTVTGIDDIHVYNAVGKMTATIPSRSETSVVTLGWSVAEDLIVVYRNGRVDIYNIRGERRDVSFALFSEISDNTVTMCAIGEQGLATINSVEDGVLQLVIVADLEDPDPVVVERVPLVSAFPPTCVGIVEPRFTQGGDMEVLIGTDDCSLLVVTAAGGAVDQELSEKLSTPIDIITVSPNGRYVSCVGRDTLVVMGTNFETKLLEFNTASDPPSQVVWCAEDAVVMSWHGKGVLVVGPLGDWGKYVCEDESVFLAAEHDCVRVYSDSQLEILQRVPVDTQLIRKIGSDAPAAMLYDAMDNFETGDAKADDNVRTLLEEDTLLAAVYGCITAATYEWDTVQQKLYLKAATYGKNFISTTDATVHNAFVDACKKLRVLNQLRELSVGLPLTVSQYDRLTPEVVIDRLVNRYQHRMALLLCDYLNIEKDRVLVHWACAKIRHAAEHAHTEPRQLCDLIRRKLLSTSAHVSYADIAATADAAGNKELATMLLEFEPRAADKVPLLLKMRAVDLALSKAIDSGDTDLVYLVLLHLKRTMIGADGDPISFFKTVCPFPEAVNLLVAYCKTQDRVLLKKLYYFTRRYREAGQLCVEEAYKCHELPARVQLLQDAANIFKAGVKAGVKGLAFHEHCTLDQVKLLKLQNALEQDNPDEAFVDLSVSETLFKLVMIGNYKKASKLQSEFKIPANRFWHLKVAALAKRGKWDTLQRFANEKKSPIGYKPFADACIDAHQFDEAVPYIERFSSVEDKIDYYIKILRWNEATELAISSRDEERMDEIRRLCPIGGIIAKLDGAR